MEETITSKSDRRASDSVFPDSFKDKHIHLVGIKGTGMAAIAEILAAKKIRLSGSDSGEKFYTDEILSELGVPVSEGFSAANIADDIALVIYSSAYSSDSNPELAEAKKRGIPCITYPEALGLLSGRSISAAICGVHGKTTTTAMAGTIVKALKLAATVITGSQVFTFGNRSTFSAGDRYLIAETCEYKRHFLNFHPTLMIITSIELDHPDYFKSLADISDAFVEFGKSLAQGGVLIYCSDDDGAREAALRILEARKDIEAIPYGSSATGDFQLKGICSGPGNINFILKGFSEEFTLKVPGTHSIYDAIAAIALAVSLVKRERGRVSNDDIGKIQDGIAGFRGSKRRTEIIGEAGGILFVDDYAHHPTAVMTTLKGIREFYPDRRLVVDFMAHTYSRTQALIKSFGECFSPAHILILHKIYASARETNEQGMSGKELFDEVARHHKNVFYYDEVMEAFTFLQEYLKPNDIFLTMGAGDNWKIGKSLYEHFKGATE